MELCTPKLKKAHIFFKKLFVLYFEKWNFLAPGGNLPSSKNKKNHSEKICYFLNKVFLLFREMELSSPKFKKLFYFF